MYRESCGFGNLFIRAIWSLLDWERACVRACVCVCVCVELGVALPIGDNGKILP